MKNKYPVDLFIIGFISNMIGRFFFLFFPAVILIMISSCVKVCLIIGLVLLGLDILLSFTQQLNIRNTTLNNNDPSFAEFQTAILSKNWKNNIKNIVENKIIEHHDEGDRK